MVDGSFDYMQLNKSPNVLESVRICFQKGYSANPSFKANISNISSKYHVMLIRFYSLGLKTSHSEFQLLEHKRVRIQSLIKAVELDLEKKIGLPSGQKAWVRCTLS
jgi:hypothetical protein